MLLEKTAGPHEPSGDMVALGRLLVAAYTGRRGTAAPAEPPVQETGPPAGPDVGVLPARLRQVVAGCLTEEPAGRPTPVQLLETIGPLTPTTRPWPPAVDELIARRRTGDAQLRFVPSGLPDLPEPGASSGIRPADPTDLVPRPVAPPVPPVPVEAPPTPGPVAPRLWLAALVVLALAGVIAVALVVLAPDRDSGPVTLATPTPSPPTLEEPLPEPTWSVDSESPEQSAPARDQVTELTAPSAEAPTPAETQQTRQPGAIADCAGEPLVEPTELLLACGDAGAGLHDLTWTNWGEETATATGWESEKVCVPNCANGTEARSPATVTVSGLTGGRYTFMQISAPQSPNSPFSRYTLDEFGPTWRG